MLGCDYAMKATSSSLPAPEDCSCIWSLLPVRRVPLKLSFDGHITQTGFVHLRSLQLTGPTLMGTCPWFRLATFPATSTHQTRPPSSATCLACCTSSVAVTRWNIWSTTPSWPRKSRAPLISDAFGGRCVRVLRGLVGWGKDDANGKKWNV